MGARYRRPTGAGARDRKRAGMDLCHCPSIAPGLCGDVGPGRGWQPGATGAIAAYLGRNDAGDQDVASGTSESDQYAPAAEPAADVRRHRAVDQLVGVLTAQWAGGAAA